MLAIVTYFNKYRNVLLHCMFQAFKSAKKILKCPYYGFLKMTCHAVCNTALSEWKHPAKF